jgi:hypothetical protein
VNKMPFFSDVFPRDEFLLLFWDPHLAHAEWQSKLKKENLIKSVLHITIQKCILHYLLSVCVTVDESTVSFKGSVSSRT